MVNRGVRFRAAPGAPPILHTGVGGAGNVRLVDSRRMRPVYLKNPNGVITANGNNSFGVAPTRVTPAGSGMNGGGNGISGNGMRRLAYISPVSHYCLVIILNTIIYSDLSLI